MVTHSRRTARRWTSTPERCPSSTDVHGSCGETPTRSVPPVARSSVTLGVARDTTAACEHARAEHQGDDGTAPDAGSSHTGG